MVNNEVTQGLPMSPQVPQGSPRVLYLSASISYTYPRPILYLYKQGVAALFSFFRNHHFQNAARWARGPVLKGPARRILKMMISEVATEGRTRPILYLCKHGDRRHL